METKPEVKQVAGRDAGRTSVGDDAHDILIVGAGFAGLYMLHRARELGFAARVLEAGDDVGGTWYWNRYPGARCDIESLEYSYGFDEDLQREWRWSERYAAQPEILAYARHVAERFDLRRDIRFGVRVAAARFDEEADGWTLTATDGRTWRARFVVMATGCLSAANLPDIPGLAGFAGRVFHTARWPHEPVDFRGRRVGVIGTGSSAVQSIPVIARAAAGLTVFQRTPTYSVPARNAPLDPDYESRIKADYRGFRARNARMPAGFGSNLDINEASALDATPAEREAAFRARWRVGGLGFTRAYGDIVLDARANATAAEFIRARIRETVRDPATAAALTPTHPVACKRLCIDSGYYETYNLSHVRLVDVAATPIEAIDAGGLVVAGRLHPCDDLVFATGFDAMTGALLRMDIRGTGGQALSDKWRAGPLNYLGLAVAGFPNLFTITGPGSPSVLTNMIVSIEQHVRWIADCVAWMRSRDLRRIEASAQAEAAWVRHVNEVAGRTIFPGCNSWYLGANVPGKPRVFMPLPGFPAYADHCETVAGAGYQGFSLA